MTDTATITDLTAEPSVYEKEMAEQVRKQEREKRRGQDREQDRGHGLDNATAFAPSSDHSNVAFWPVSDPSSQPDLINGAISVANAVGDALKDAAVAAGEALGDAAGTAGDVIGVVAGATGEALGVAGDVVGGILGGIGDILGGL